MNFFDKKGRHLVVASDVWIYVATWLPMTFITVAGYRVLKSYHEPKDSGLLHELRKVFARKRVPMLEGRRVTNKDVESSASYKSG